MRRMTVLLLAATALAACADDAGKTGPGSDMTRVLLTDAPFPFDLVQSVNVHIVSIDAATTFDTTTTVDWIPLVTPDRQFDLLQLQDGETALLGEADVRATDYAAIRMVIRTDLSGITLIDGSPATVNWMGPATQTIHAGIEQPLDIRDGPSDAALIIDFDVGRSFVVMRGGCDSLAACPYGRGFQFLPWIRAVNEDATGTIRGTVRGTIGDSEVLVPVPYANITVYRGTNSLTLAATGRADADGEYRLHYVSGGGPYVVEAVPPSGTAGGYGYARDLYVNAGAETVADVTLGTSTGGEPNGQLQITGPGQVGVGETIYLNAFVFNENGDSVFGTAVTWEHSNPGVAQLGGAGASATLTGLQPGLTTVTARAGDLADSVLIAVGQDNAPVASVDIVPAGAALAVGDSVGFQAILKDSLGNVLDNRTVSWSVDDSSKLSIMSTFGHYALVRALASGSTVLRATAGGKEDAVTVTIQ